MYRIRKHPGERIRAKPMTVAKVFPSVKVREIK